MNVANTTDYDIYVDIDGFTQHLIVHAHPGNDQRLLLTGNDSSGAAFSFPLVQTATRKWASGGARLPHWISTHSEKIVAAIRAYRQKD